MKRYNVEGFYIPMKGSQRKNASQSNKPDKMEFFHSTVWANDAKEALKEATLLLNGGRWKEIPRISDMTEEKRMRKLHAPELPGLEKTPTKHR